MDCKLPEATVFPFTTCTVLNMFRESTPFFSKIAALQILRLELDYEVTLSSTHLMFLFQEIIKASQLFYRAQRLPETLLMLHGLLCILENKSTILHFRTCRVADVATYLLLNEIRQTYSST